MKKVLALCLLCAVPMVANAYSLFSGSCIGSYDDETKKAYFLDVASIMPDSSFYEITASLLAGNFTVFYPKCTKGKAYRVSYYGASVDGVYGSCTGCRDGYILQNRTLPLVFPVVSGNTFSCSSLPSGYTYKECVEATDCDGYTEWQTIGSCYQLRYRRAATGGICQNVETQYRCSQNCYGTTTSGVTGCQQCPNVGLSMYHPVDEGTVLNVTVSGLTDGAGATDVSECYINRVGNLVHLDDSGELVYTDKCYYGD